MAKQKPEDEKPGDEFVEENSTPAEVKAPEDPTPAEEEVQPEPPPITEHMWKGVKKVYRCGFCGRNEDDQGEMQLHYLNHFPPEEREAILNKLLEE